MRLFYFSIFVLLVSLQQVKGQACIDTLGTYSTYVCPTPEFYPVCGCDGKTYRNECEAKFRHGVQRYSSGSCSGFEIDILPNITDRSINFTLEQTGIPSFVRLGIMDSWGKIMEFKNLTILPHYYESIDVSSFQQGVYFLIAYDSFDHYRFRKFVVYHQ